MIPADPAWEDDFGHCDHDTELHYPTMTLEEIKALPVPEHAAPDAVLYLWALPHMVPKALDVMMTWGFEFRTSMVWAERQDRHRAMVPQSARAYSDRSPGQFPAAAARRSVVVAHHGSA